MKPKKKLKDPNDQYKRTIVVTLKVNPEEMRKILAKAHAHAEGNASSWLRFAALNYIPKASDFVD